MLESAATLCAEAVKRQRAGEVREAAELYRSILQFEPRHADSLHYLGLCHFQWDQHAEAVGYFTQAIEIDATKSAYHNNLGLAFRAMGRHEDAAKCFADALALKQDGPIAHHNLSVTFHELGRDAESRRHARRAKQFRGTDAQTLLRDGKRLLKQRQAQEALACLEEAAELDPGSAAIQFALGSAFQVEQDYEQAERHFREATQLASENIEAWTGLGAALTELSQLPEAETALRHAVELAPERAVTHSHLAVALMHQGRYVEAEGVCREALRLDPTHLAAEANLGTLLLRMGRTAEGLRSLESVIRSKPDLADARWNRALTLLSLGRWEEGWLEYEWRWARGIPSKRKIPRPLWDGGPLEGKRILLHAEQGLGDAIQFVRYARSLVELGAEVLLACHHRLLPLMRLQPYLAEVFEFKNNIPAFDVHAPLMSVPGILKTTLESVPYDVPYLQLDSELQAAWREKLSAIEGFKVGIVWQGNSKFSADRLRSVPLRHFSTLAEVEPVQLISLQVGEGTEQIEEAGELDLMTFPDLDTESGAFMDTAAILKSLDLVICSDTSIAHLAGAIGTPVWLAVSHAPDWRWLVDRSDSPWYPTMRIFRQQTPGDWQAVFAEIRGALEQHVANRSVDTAAS